MKSFFQDYLAFSKTERIGIAVLAFLIIAGVVAPRIYANFRGESSTDFSDYRAEVAAFQKAKIEGEERTLFEFDPNEVSLDELKSLGLPAFLARRVVNYREKVGPFRKVEDFARIYDLPDSLYQVLRPYLTITKRNTPAAAPKKSTEEKTKSIELFSFDPNTVTREELQRLGVSGKGINILMKYRSKGGRFRQKEELGKIYGISEATFERLLPYIEIDATQFESKWAKAKEEKKSVDKVVSAAPTLILDINEASVEEWQKLRGIGPTFSKRIVNFRDKLGGFISLNQLAETYGLADSTFQSIKPQLQLVNPEIRQINLNTAKLEDLSKHPYLNRKQAQGIINYRSQHGDFQSVEGLDNILSLDQKTKQRIRPYLRVD